MGSIVYIIREPKNLIVVQDGYQSKVTGENLLKIIYGNYDDYDGCCDLTIYIRESVLNKLYSGEYHIGEFSKTGRNFIIFDKEGNMIQPIKEDFCY